MCDRKIWLMHLKEIIVCIESIYSNVNLNVENGNMRYYTIPFIVIHIFIILTYFPKVFKAKCFLDEP